MKTKHTPEPWKYKDEKIYVDGTASPEIFIGEDKKNMLVVARAYSWNTKERPLSKEERLVEARANAKRLSSCVNACAGIDNPEKIKDLVDAAEKAITLLYFGCRGIHGLRVALRALKEEITDTPKKKGPGRWD